MSNPSTPSHDCPSHTGEARTPEAPIEGSWPGFVEDMIAKHGAVPTKPVVDRLTLQEEAELDRYMAAGVDLDEACTECFSRKVPPLFLAISRRSHPLVNALLARGASISMMTLSVDDPSAPSVKESALAWALHYNSANPHCDAILSAILANHATLSPEEVNAPNYLLMRTPLAICAKSRNALVRDVLMAHGADVMCIDRDGQTLLHILADSQSHSLDSFKEDEEWMRWMLDHGVALDALDAQGNTALDLARIRRGVDDPFVALLDSTRLDHLTAQPPRSVAAPSRRI